MKPENNYQITNIINKEKKMAALQAQVLAKSSEKALDGILDAPFPAALVQSFPDQDIHFLMHHIGVDDFLPVLSLATSQQWEYLLDVEIWQQDRLDMIQMTRSLALLFKAEPQRFLRWIITEKPDFIEYYFFRNMEIRIREHDEDPSDFGEGFATLDSLFYFRFPQTSSRDPEPSDGFEETMTGEEGEIQKNAENAATLISDMLNSLAEMDLSVYHAVMLETTSVIPAEIEEEQFRLKNVRLAEKGLLPYHESIAIYQPLNPADLKKRPAFYLEKSLYADDLPLPPQFSFSMPHKNMPHKKNLFAACLARIEEDVAVNLQAEFAFLVNSVIATEKRPVRSIQELEESVEKSSCYLSTGLELIHSHLYGRAGEKEQVPNEVKAQRRTDEEEVQRRTDEEEHELTEEIAQGSSQEGHDRIQFALEEGAELIRHYALKDIFRVGSGAGLALKKRVEQWLARSWIVENSLNLTFLGEKWLGITGGILLDRPLYFDNYKTGVPYRPFASLEEIDDTSRELDAIVRMDQMLERLNPDLIYFSGSFLTWEALFLTLWARQRMGIDNISAPIPLKPFKLFFEQLFSTEKLLEKNGQGIVSKIVRQDFFNWLEEKAIIEREELRSLNSTVRNLFESVFDELEDESGSVAPADLDPELIRHFILEKESE